MFNNLINTFKLWYYKEKSLKKEHQRRDILFTIKESILDSIGWIKKESFSNEFIISEIKRFILKSSGDDKLDLLDIFIDICSLARYFDLKREQFLNEVFPILYPDYIISKNELINFYKISHEEMRGFLDVKYKNFKGENNHTYDDILTNILNYQPLGYSKKEQEKSGNLMDNCSTGNFKGYINEESENDPKPLQILSEPSRTGLDSNSINVLNKNATKKWASSEIKNFEIPEDKGGFDGVTTTLNSNEIKEWFNAFKDKDGVIFWKFVSVVKENNFKEAQEQYENIFKIWKEWNIKESFIKNIGSVYVNLIKDALAKTAEYIQYAEEKSSVENDKIITSIIPKEKIVKKTTKKKTTKKKSTSNIISKKKSTSVKKKK